MTTPAHPNDIIIPTPMPAAVVVSGELIEKTAAFIAKLSDHAEITDNTSLQTMRALVKDTSRFKSQVKAAQGVAKAPFESVIAQIDAKAKAIIADLDSVMNEGKRQEAEFLTERDRKLAEEREYFRKQEEVAKLDTSRPTPALTILPIAEVVQAPTAQRADMRVIDESLIPAAYREINWVRVRADVLAGKVVPGVEKIMVTTVVAR